MALSRVMDAAAWPDSEGMAGSGSSAGAMGRRPADITDPGTESNVKSLRRLRTDRAGPGELIFNQFSESGPPGPLLSPAGPHNACSTISERRTHGSALRAFVSATGSAGPGRRTPQGGLRRWCAVAAWSPHDAGERVRDTTPGIGDKHIRSPHVRTTDAVVAVSDQGHRRLDVLFNTTGRRTGRRRGVPNDARGDCGFGDVQDLQSGRGDQDGEALRPGPDDAVSPCGQRRAACPGPSG